MFKMWKVSEAVCLLFLGGCSVFDIKRREIPLVILIAGSTVLAVSRILVSGTSPLLSLMGGVLGTGFLLISKFTKEAFGYADSWIICILGIYTGIWKLAEVLMLSFFLCSVAAMICLVKTGWSQKVTLPFIPFITAAYTGVMLL